VERIGCALRHAVKTGQRPNCGCSRQRRGPSQSASPLRRGRVTVSNYREVARGFDREGRARLAEILRRHDRGACCYCSKGRKCPTAAEAVEAVTVEEAYGLRGERAGRHFETDYRRMEMYG
jgi:hypothetical protein